ncbi:MAG: DMT family transporter [Pseudobdellovibrionaceae bacterium]
MFFQNLNGQTRAFFCALLGFSSFAIGDAAYKWLADVAPPMVNGMIGAGLAVVLVLLYGAFKGEFLSFWTIPKRKLHLLRGVLIAAQFLLFLYAYSHLPLTTAYAVIFCAPFLTVLLAPLLIKEPFHKAEGIAALIGFAGVLLAFPPNPDGLELTAFLAALGSAVFVALINILANFIGPQERNGYAFAVYAIGITFFIALGLVLANGDPLPDITPKLGFAYLLAGASGIGGVVMVAIAFTKAKTGFIASTHYVQIFWGVVLGYLLFGDIPSLQVIAGISLIVGSGIYLLRYGIKP